MYHNNNQRNEFLRVHRKLSRIRLAASRKQCSPRQSNSVYSTVAFVTRTLHIVCGWIIGHNTLGDKFHYAFMFESEKFFCTCCLTQIFLFHLNSRRKAEAALYGCFIFTIPRPFPFLRTTFRTFDGLRSFLRYWQRCLIEFYLTLKRNSITHAKLYLPLMKTLGSLKVKLCRSRFKRDESDLINK